MASLLSIIAVFITIVAIVGLASASPIIRSRSPTVENIDITLAPLENSQGGTKIVENVITHDCVELPAAEINFPKKLNLITNDPELYDVKLYDSTGCRADDEVSTIRGSTDIVVNDRHPICSFQLDLEDGNPPQAPVTVLFRLQNSQFKVKLDSWSGIHDHDICKGKAAFRFAEKINVYSEDPHVDAVRLFIDSVSTAVTARNDTNIVQKTLKQENRILVRSLKVVPHHL